MNNGGSDQPINGTRRANASWSFFIQKSLGQRVGRGVQLGLLQVGQNQVARSAWELLFGEENDHRNRRLGRVFPPPH